MRITIHALAALALGLAAPVAATELAEGEIMLRINAQGSVKADFAAFEQGLRGTGVTRVEAEAQLRERTDGAIAFLEANGIDRSAATLSETRFEEDEQYEWERARDARPSPPRVVPVTIAPPTVRAAPPPPVRAVPPPAIEIAPPVRTNRNDRAEIAEEGPAEPVQMVKVWVASSTMTTRVAMGEFARLQAQFRTLYGGPFQTPSFQFRDEAKAQRDAVAAAVAKARADADIYADVMGYRVVRVAGLSNDGPPLSVPGVVQAITSLAAASPSALREAGITGDKIALVSVDFVLAPR